MATKKPSKKGKKIELPGFIDEVELKHNFTAEENVDLFQRLCHQNEEYESLISQSKSSAKQWKGKLDQVELSINDLSRKGRDGFEMRKTKVRVVLNKKEKTKTILNADTGEFIEEQMMTEYDFERLPMTILPDSKSKPLAPDEGLASVGEAMDTAESKASETDMNDD